MSDTLRKCRSRDDAVPCADQHVQQPAAHLQLKREIAGLPVDAQRERLKPPPPVGLPVQFSGKTSVGESKDLSENEKKETEELLIPGHSTKQKQINEGGKFAGEEAYKKAVKKEVTNFIVKYTSVADERRGSSNELDISTIRGAAEKFGKTAVLGQFGADIKAASMSPEARQALDAFKFDDKKYVKTYKELKPAEVDKASQDLLHWAITSADFGLKAAKATKLHLATDPEAVTTKVKNQIWKSGPFRSRIKHILKHWPAMENAETKEVFIQTKLPLPPVEEQHKHTDWAKKEWARLNYWGAFQTLIHEYCHVCSHPNFHNAAHNPPFNRNRNLTEGFCEYYTRIAWGTLKSDSTNPNSALKKAVEGPVYDKTRLTVPPRKSYETEHGVAKNVAGKVTDANMKAAYFMGHMEKLGLGSWTKNDAGDRGVYAVPAGGMKLSKIAAITGVSQQVIKTNNEKLPIKNGKVVAGTAVSCPGIAYHRAIENDNLDAIAKQWDVTKAALEKANGSGAITAGQRILIPAKTT